MMTKVSGVKVGYGARPDSTGVKAPGGKRTFSDFLRKACMERDIKISAHAEQRIVQRGIELVRDDIENISDAMEKLSEKGGSKAAIFCRDVVFIADARNRAIITAIDSDELKERIFTGIDSAVIL